MLMPVESSHVAAVGYIEADQVLLVRFIDGALYAFPGVTVAQYAELMEVPSKGRWIAKFRGQEVRIQKGVMPTETGESTTVTAVARPGGDAVASSGPLNLIDQDADKCCRKSFESASRSEIVMESLFAGGQTWCEECGTRFAPEMVGSTRYWRIVPQVHIIRK
jgi:cell division GTPase FtsZ